MRRISSRTTFYQKRIFPLFFFVWLVASIAFPVLIGLKSGQYPPIQSLAIPIVIGIVFFFFIKMTVFDLVDEVWDAGDAIIIKNKNQEERVALSEIMNVSYSPDGTAPRVTVLLRRPGIFGSSIHFCPPLRLKPFLASPVDHDLIQRIDAKRRAR